MKKIITFMAIFLSLSILVGCTPTVEIFDEQIATAQAPSMGYVPLQGTVYKQVTKATIDYSYAAEGYVTVNYTEPTSNKLKVQVKGPKTIYTYNLSVNQWECFPLSDGNGSYSVVVYENVKNAQYAAVISATFTVTLKDEFMPFLYPNQYVNYTQAPLTVAKAKELCNGITNDLEKVEKIYDFVVTNISYDSDLAKSVQSGYLPVLDRTLKDKKGICFDYAALMTGMLRSQNIPCKLVIGYAGTAYHAWISVWSNQQGWVDSVIQFDGKTWHRMDPTFASSSNKSQSIMNYIGDGNNYSVKYLY